KGTPRSWSAPTVMPAVGQSKDSLQRKTADPMARPFFSKFRDRRSGSDRGRDELTLLQVGDQAGGGLFWLLVGGLECDFRVLRRLVRIGNPGELLDLPGESLCVETLDVALGADVDRSFDVHLDEPVAHQIA